MAEHQNTFHLTVASVGETRFDGAALSVTLPGIAGELTILPHHEPIVTTLRPGKITVRESLGEKTFDIENGVAECTGERVVVLL
jgi:F-type H+-transporting ATPase subunit epsilon